MQISDYVYYEDGKLFNKVGRGNIKAGKELGTLTNKGYLSCTVVGKTWKVHRLIYTLLKGKIPDGLQIDHINGNKTDNRIENLRLVTNQENCFNTKAKGFTWSAQHGKFRSKIMKDGKESHLGLYDTILDARAAYLRAKRELHTIEEVSDDNTK